MLDRDRMRSYVGDDAAFEREFLGLLEQTVDGCLLALKAPTREIYATLHAAKAGLSVATGEEARLQMESVCSLTANLHSDSLAPEVRAALAQLVPTLTQINSEIRAALR